MSADIQSGASAPDIQSGASGPGTQSGASGPGTRSGAEIALQGLEKRFGALEVLRGLSLQVRPGELFTLLGPSGCGKTTLLRILAGFERPDAGDVRADGSSILHLPPHRRGMGVVFQSHAVFPHLSVAENVAFGLRERGVSGAELAARVATALERVRLPGLGARRPDQLSGGQQQRVGLARALAIEPRALLLDEPLSSLDARLRVELREEIRELVRALGLTAVYVTHDQEEALAISDRIAVLERGEALQVGAPAELYGRPATRQVAAFVGRMNFLTPDQARAIWPAAAAGATVAGATVAGATVAGATVAVRPEDLLLEEPGSAAEGLAGQVLRRSCLGSLTTWVIGDPGPDAPRLLVERHRASAGPDPAEGAPVRLRMRPGSGHLFDPVSGARLEPGP